MNIIGDKNAAEILTRAATRTDKEPGLRISYFEGDYSSEVNKTAVGKAAYGLAQAGLVRLFQKKIQDEPRLYSYIAEVV